MLRLRNPWMLATAVGVIASNAWAQSTAWQDSPAATATPKAEPKTAAAKAEPKASATQAPAKVDSSAPAANSPPAPAAAPSNGFSVEASASTDATPAAATSAQTAPATAPEAAPVAGAPPPAVEDNSKSWLDQLLLTDGIIELGATAGLLFPSRVLNLQEQTLKHQHLATAPELGVRIGYFPIKYAGGELEYVVGFSKTDKDDQGATTWGLRASLIGQYPGKRIVPFALLGAGRLGVFSNTMGNDGDPAFIWGVGAKAPLTDLLLARLDIRDNMAQKHGSSDGTLCNSFEVLLGLSLTLGRPQPPPAKIVEDSDGDGLVDRVDKCPHEAGAGADGCPLKDTDNDGVLDSEDKCVDVKGEPPDGCPPAPKDTDADGVPDATDKCIDVKGEPPDGCPSNRDSDGDGIIDSKDKCPNAAETKNGFEDDDGCPDELPAKVKSFTGVIQGIEFDRDKATIRPNSSAVLDKSAAVLSEFPSLRVLITGHTDNTGTREKNVQLSKERAESVKAYLVGKGIVATRVETKGAGPDEPIDSNVTAAGRQRNRRIEFRLLKDSD